VADLRFEGCAIVSADGMLADARGDQPADLIVEADKQFFDATLEASDLIVHGRNSHEGQKNSPRRKRLYATRRIAAIESHPTNPNALRWNPAGATVEEAAAQLGVRAGVVAIIGGTEVFDLFLDRYDLFWLTVAQRARLPGGVPLFSGIPPKTPHDVLRAHGLQPGETRVLDERQSVDLIRWDRSTA
jgi:dihydrofolate reductase